MEAHAYNPSYSKGVDQEDHGSRPAHAKVNKTLSQPIAGHGGTCLSFQLQGSHR
jgi:hypothetical protein